MASATRVPSSHSLSTSELLHRIRACVDDIHSHARGQHDHQHAVRQRLDHLLRNAMCAQSPSEIAIALGCAAELQLFPDESVLEFCTETVRRSGVGVLRAVIWTVRHRYARYRRYHAR